MNPTDKIKATIEENIAVKKLLLEKCSDSIAKCGTVLADLYGKGGKVMFCGNGGSAADSQHLAAELVIRLRGQINRPALPAMALTVDSSIMTAGGNDIGFENVFARQVEAFGKKGDAIVGISTSGNSENVLRAVKCAKSKELITIGLLGCSGGKIRNECEYSVVVPSDITARIQECHIMIGHIWCEIIEEILYPEHFKK
ncbi:MAG: D-sedoheptulose 7-phosphate isomerase [Ignavibacteriae bacterium]|nr:D-sedoheptulose 7-phosphate isomerase [Ignavibacteriota bacterium]